jgi:hypothetical protein
MSYAIMTFKRLTGRCANGYQRDRGTRIHALPIGSQIAICGATYGRRSAGWSEWNEQEVTCPKCVRKLSREAKPQEAGEDE